MLKLSITLPNGTQVTLESDGSEPVHDVLALMLSSVQQDARPLDEGHPAPGVHPENTAEKGNGATGQNWGMERAMPLESGNGFHAEGASGLIPETEYVARANGLNGHNGHSNGDGGDSILDLSRCSSQAKQDFVAFCEAVNPVGDMRRVVVATEAASRFFDMEGITADEAGDLFDLVGWLRAKNFTQTIRNAARQKFGWLERIPHSARRYAVTDLGRSTTLSR